MHCTYLRRDGSGKADIEKPKAIFGPVSGGAVRFGSPRAGEWLAVAEGIETALSVAVACSMPAWAALSAGGIKNFFLPREATHVVICADHDTSGIGERAARDAAERWLAKAAAFTSRCRPSLAPTSTMFSPAAPRPTSTRPAMSRDNIRAIVENAEDEKAEPPRPLMRELPPADPFPVDALGDVLRPPRAPSMIACARRLRSADSRCSPPPRSRFKHTQTSNCQWGTLSR